MNIAFALDYIPRRMDELGYGCEYLTRYRHVRVLHNDQVTIKAHNQYWIFIEPETGIFISSDRGVYNPTDDAVTEQQHEHSGVISVYNSTGATAYVLFIQVIPKNKKQS